MHFAVDFQVRRAVLHDLARGGHLARRFRDAAAEVRVRQQGDLRHHAETQHFVGGLDGDAGHFVGRRVFVDVRVGDEQRLVGQHQHVQGGVGLAFLLADDFVDVLELVVVLAGHAAQQRVGIATAQQHRADQRVVLADHRLGDGRRHAFTALQLVVRIPRLVEAAVVFGIDDLEVLAGDEAQAGLLDAHLDDGGTADQDRERQLFVGDRLHGAQDAFVFAVGIDDALGRLLGLGEQRTHQLARVVHEAHQLLAVGFDVLDGAGSHAGVGGGLRDGRGDLHDQARIEWLRDDVLGAERQFLAGVGAGDFIVLLGLRQIGDGLDARQLHFLGDARGAGIHGAAEDEGEAQDVVDLVRVVRAAGCDDAVGARGLGDFGADFRFRVGQGQDQRTVGHGLDHVGGQHAGGGAAQEHVGAVDHVGERARVGLLRVALLVGFHVLVAAVPDDAARVHHEDVFALDAQVNQEVQAGDGGSAGAGASQLDRADVLVHDLQAVQDGGRRDDGGAVLVVVEDGDLHALAQLLLDVEALGRLDVFKVDAAQRGFQRGDDVDELVRIVLGQFNVEHVDAGEFLEQATLAFHHGLGGQRADVAQTQHGGAVGDHAHEVAARRVLGGRVVALVENGHASRSHAGGVGQGQVVLVGQGLGRGDRDFAGSGIGVVVQRQFGESFVHGIGA